MGEKKYCLGERGRKGRRGEARKGTSNSLEGEGGGSTNAKAGLAYEHNLKSEMKTNQDYPATATNSTPLSSYPLIYSNGLHPLHANLFPIQTGSLQSVPISSPKVLPNNSMPTTDRQADG